MSDPKDPDWGFPEVDPASTELPPDEDLREALDALSARTVGEGPYDTGSDAWWRAQAAAQRAAAAEEPGTPSTPPGTAGTPPEPAPEPPPLVEPEVLLPEPAPPPEPPRTPAPEPGVPSPLDAQWLPEDLSSAPSGPPREAAPTPPVAPTPPPPVAPTSPPPVAPPAPPVPPTEPPRPVVPPTAAPPVPSAPAPPPVPPLPPVPPVPAAPPPPVDPHETVELPPYVATGTTDAAFYESLRAAPHASPVGPRRALLGALVAIAGVVLAIGALYLFLHDDEPTGGPTVALPTTSASTSAAPSPTPTPRRTPTATARPTPTASPTAAVVAPVRPVTVLNNSRIKGLAERSAARFSAGGWPIAAKGNYRGGVISRTTVYYAPGQLGTAQRFARQFGIGRVLPRFSGLPGSGLTVVLTRDYR